MQYPVTLVCTDRDGHRLDSSIVRNAEQSQAIYDRWHKEHRQSDGSVPYIFVAPKKPE